MGFPFFIVKMYRQDLLHNDRAVVILGSPTSHTHEVLYSISCFLLYVRQLRQTTVLLTVHSRAYYYNILGLKLVELQIKAYSGVQNRLKGG